MKAVKVVAFVLTIIGSLNWGLVGLFKFDLVKAIFGGHRLRPRRSHSRDLRHTCSECPVPSYPLRQSHVMTEEYH